MIKKIEPNCPICDDGISREQAGEILDSLREQMIDESRNYEPTCTLCGETCSVKSAQQIVERMKGIRT